VEHAKRVLGVPAHQEPVVSTLKGGLTNRILRVEALNGKAVVARIYGASMIDRERELRISKEIGRTGSGPEIFFEWPRGRIESFVAGRSFSMTDFHNPVILDRIGARLASLHSLHVFKGDCKLGFDDIDDWILKAKCIGSGKFLDCVEQLEKNWKVVSKFLRSLESPVVMCHNDLNEGNIIVCEEIDSAGNLRISDIHLLDFEYSAPSFRGYDFGNFLCEVFIQNNHPDPPLFKIECSWKLTEEEENILFRSYLSNFQKIPLDQVKTSDVESLRKESRAFMLASHAAWCAWGFIQAEISTLKWSFEAYARARLELFDTEFEASKLSG